MFSDSEHGSLATMPILVPDNTEQLLVCGTAYCETLDLGICFAAGTPVLMADGTTKPIETLQPGDRVLSAPENNVEGAVAAKTVERVFHNPPSELIRLTIGGTELRSTPPHLFYVRDKGWTAAEDLQVGDQLRTPDARWVALDAKQAQPDPEPVYNFRVADYHTYFVGDPAGGEAVLVHNEYGPVGPFTPSGAPITGDSTSVLQTIWDLLTAYGQTAANGEQASSLAGFMDAGNDMLWPFGEWPYHHGAKYDHNDDYHRGRVVGSYTGLTINAVLTVSGIQGTVTAIGAIRAAGGMTYSVGRLAVCGGQTMEFVILNGEAVALTPALAAELGISATGVGNIVNSVSNGEGDLGARADAPSAVQRALTEADLGITTKLVRLEGTIATSGRTTIARIDVIKGAVPNPFALVENLIGIARAQGSATLRIEGTLVLNPRLIHIMQVRYGAVMEAGRWVITLPL